MHNRLLYFILIICLHLATPVLAQKKNFPTEIVNGVECYLYPVEKSEGFYRIGRKFDVKKKLILQYNPEAKDGLKLGQVLRIPVSEEHLEESVISVKDTKDVEFVGTKKQVPIATDTLFIKHVIQPKETLYRISKNYNITIAELQQYNPEVTRNMPIGATLLIPRSGLAMSPDILTAALTQKPDENDVKDSVQIISSVRNSDIPISSQEPIRVACLLPFMLDAPKFDPSVNRFVEFYQGLLLGLNELKKEGARVDLYVYDTEKTEQKMKEILQDSVLKSMDLIIGPTYTQQVDTVVEFARENKVPTVVPFATNIPGIDTVSYVYRFNSAKGQEGRVLSEYFADTATYSLTYVQHSSIPQLRKSVVAQALFEQLEEKELPYGVVDTDVHGLDSLYHMLDTAKINLLVFDSEQIKNIQYIMPTLIRFTREFRIEILGHYSWLNSVQSIPIPFYYISLFNESVTYAASTNYDHKYVQYFGQSISSRNPRYDKLGYDLIYYFVSALRLYDKEQLQSEISDFYSPGLLVEPIFRNDNVGSGMKNRHLYIFKRAYNMSNMIYEYIPEKITE